MYSGKILWIYIELYFMKFEIKKKGEMEDLRFNEIRNI